MTSKLKVSQIIKILNLYTPADEFEVRLITMTVSNLIQIYTN